MPQHAPDTDITFVYVKELSESIRSVGGLMQTLTGEIHLHAVTLHQLKEQVLSMSKTVDKLSTVMYDGHNGKPGMSNRVDEVERDIRDIRKDRDEEKRKEEAAHGRGKSMRAAVAIAIVSATLSLIGQLVSWGTSKAVQSVTPPTTTPAPIK
jgi:hypothetical protein